MRSALWLLWLERGTIDEVGRPLRRLSASGCRPQRQHHAVASWAVSVSAAIEGERRVSSALLTPGVEIEAAACASVVPRTERFHISPSRQKLLRYQSRRSVGPEETAGVRVVPRAHDTARRDGEHLPGGRCGVHRLVARSQTSAARESPQTQGTLWRSFSLGPPSPPKARSLLGNIFIASR